MKLSDILLAGVATWRVTHMFLYENGPFRIFRRIRERFGMVYEDAESTKVVSFKYEVLLCPWCMSMWVGMVLTLLLRWSSWGRWLYLPFVLSACSVFVDKTLEKLRDKQPEFPDFRVQ